MNFGSSFVNSKETDFLARLLGIASTLTGASTCRGNLPCNHRVIDSLSLGSLFGLRRQLLCQVVRSGLVELPDQHLGRLLLRPTQGREHLQLHADAQDARRPHAGAPCHGGPLVLRRQAAQSALTGHWLQGLVRDRHRPERDRGMMRECLRTRRASGREGA